MDEDNMKITTKRMVVEGDITMSETDSDKPSTDAASAQTVIEKVLFNIDLVENIFQRLELADMNKFSTVCMQWCAFAHKLWEKITYDCFEQYKIDKNKITDDLKERPLLKNIKIRIFNTGFHQCVLDSVIQYVEDLHSIEMYLPSSLQIQRMVSKFQNLRSVTLDYRNDELLPILEHLGACEELETLKLIKYISMSGKLQNKKCPPVCRVIADKFPALKVLVLTKLDVVDSEENLQHLLQQKSEKLEYLEVSFEGPVDSAIINSVNECAKLEDLTLELCSPNRSLNLSNLQALKRLTLKFLGEYSVEAVRQTCESVHCENLEKVFVYSNLDASLLGLFLTKCRKMQELCLKGSELNTINEQLAEVHHFDNLHSLCIGNCTGLSNSSLEYIGKFYNLEKLVLYNCQREVNSLEHLEKCTKIKTMSISGADFSRAKLAKTLLALSNLQHLYLNNCNIPKAELANIRENMALCRPNMEITIDLCN